MSPKYLDLRPDRNLIKSNFDGYKLSLTPTPILRQDLVAAPFRAKPTEDQYSFLHTELFSMHNHLTQDPWDRYTSYFFGSSGDILKATYDENIGPPKPVKAVYTLSNLLRSKAGVYNISFQFISEKFCVFVDGDDELILFDTGDRYKNSNWKVEYQCKISSESSGFLLRDSRLDTVDGTKIISFCLQHVHNDSKVHLNQLYWCTIKEILKNEWVYENRDVLFSRGVLYYCAFEPKAQSLVLSSNKEYKLTNCGIGSDIPEGNLKSEIEEKILYLSYSWDQTDKEIIIKFPRKENINRKDDYTVICTKNNITAKCLEEVLLEGQLYSCIDINLTIWILENDVFQITLRKETAVIWPFLIKDIPTESSEMENKLIKSEKPISNLEAQIEECDFPVALDEEYYIDRINLEAEGVTHRIVLGNNCPIFSTCLRPGFPPAIVTRQDVDASIWLQHKTIKPDDWNLRHEANLHAFGYVQASKQQKKFVGCAPDLSYSVICESHRHVFIYKASYENADGLRNRIGPQVSIGQQSLVTVEDAGEILGMSTSDSIITLITEKFILYLQLRVS